MANYRFHMGTTTKTALHQGEETEQALHCPGTLPRHTKFLFCAQFLKVVYVATTVAPNFASSDMAFNLALYWKVLLESYSLPPKAFLLMFLPLFLLQTPCTAIGDGVQEPCHTNEKHLSAGK